MPADENSANTVSINNVAHTSDTGVSDNTDTNSHDDPWHQNKMNIILHYTTERGSCSDC
jgi:hypothetical protein